MSDQKIKIMAANYKAVFGTDAGQEVLEDLAKKFREKESPYVQGSFDGTAKNIGIQEAMRYIRSMIDMDLDVKRQTETVN